jgi:hypothetical protein
MPTPLGEVQKEELYKHAGRAIVELSNAENHLALIFCFLCVPVEIDDAKAMFSSQGSFERKTKLVNFMVARANRARDIEAWTKIYKELNTHRSFRNLIAHQRLFMEMSRDAPFVEVSLNPLFHDSRGKRVNTADIKATADELSSINSRLHEFVVQLGEPKAVD